VLDFFQDKIWRTFCLGWLGTVILLISASCVVMITDVSHQHLAVCLFLKPGSNPGPAHVSYMLCH
jgi:hypothetical protein